MSDLNEQIQTNYRIWKKNTPFLYDYLTTYSLLWPSMSVQFFPDLERVTNTKDSISDSDANNHDVLIQRLVLGTFTLGQAIDNISILQLPCYENLNKNLNIDKMTYNPHKLEFELNKVPKKKMSVLQKINHSGDVNKLRYMPQNPDVIASGNNFGELFIYDRTKHSSYKNTIEDSEIAKPQLQLGTVSDGEGQDIFAIDWNKQKQGEIISGSMSGVINVYDLQTQLTSESKRHIMPLQTHQTDGSINHIEWMPDHDSLFSIVKENGEFMLYDTRENKAIITQRLSPNAINSFNINPSDLKYFSTGDNEGTVQIWDIRTITHQKPVFNLSSIHQESITQVKWHPRYHNILGSCSFDKTVKLLDLNKLTHNQDPVLFIHAGHMLGVNDFDWSLHDDWMVSSVADDNSVHVWKPTKTI